LDEICSDLGAKDIVQNVRRGENVYEMTCNNLIKVVKGKIQVMICEMCKSIESCKGPAIKDVRSKEGGCVHQCGRLRTGGGRP